jgi:hypothetical protein
MKPISSRQGRRAHKIVQKKKSSFFVLFAFLLHPFRKLFIFFLKNPKIFYFIFIFLSVLSISITTFFLVKKYVEHILPNHIYINVENKDIENKINGKVIKILSSVKNKNISRSEFLAQVKDYLSSIDIIQDYWVRLGLDGRLIISATLHVPLVFLETKSGDTFLMSYNGTIIAKNVPKENYPGLFTIYLPDSKIFWQPKSLWLKNEKRASAPVLQTSSSVNLIWLAGQVKSLREESLRLGADYALERMSWGPDKGFSILMSKHDSEWPSFHVILGRDKIPEKMFKLRFLLDRLYLENMSPREIDLDFPDRASFRVSTKDF